ADGLAPVEGLPVEGLPADETPACLQARAAVLADAPLVSVVVATHNRTASLLKTLESLLAQDYPRTEIIVVDNAPSTDETAEAVRRLAAETGRVSYAREDRPGLAVAHNRGLQDVSGAFVAFTDDDVIADRHWVTEL